MVKINLWRGLYLSKRLRRISSKSSVSHSPCFRHSSQWKTTPVGHLWQVH